MKVLINPGEMTRRVLATLAVELPHLHNELMALADEPLGIHLEILAGKLKQTDPQRGYYWRSLKWWGAQVGYSAKESEEILHRAVCCEAFGVLKRVQIRDSVIEIPNMTSSRLNREQYSVLIETMLRVAVQWNNVVIPDAERAA